MYTYMYTHTHTHTHTHVYVLIQGNLQVSDQFFAHTLTICSMDPLVFNEIGVLRYLQVGRGLVRGR